MTTKKHIDLHFTKKPKVDSSLFRTQQDHGVDYDTRAKIRVNMHQLITGAEVANDKTICHASTVVHNIVEDFNGTYGLGFNPVHFRWGATPDVKEAIGDDYKLLVTMAYKVLKENHKAVNNQ